MTSSRLLMPFLEQGPNLIASFCIIHVVLLSLACWIHFAWYAPSMVAILAAVALATRRVLFALPSVFFCCFAGSGEENVCGETLEYNICKAGDTLVGEAIGHPLLFA